MRNNSSAKRIRETLLKSRRGQKVPSRKLLPKYSNVHDFGLDLALLKAEVSMKNQVHTVVLKGAEHLACIFSDVSYFVVALEARC